MSADFTSGGIKFSVDKRITFEVFGFDSPDAAVDAAVKKAATFISFFDADLAVDVWYVQGNQWTARLVATWLVPARAREMPRVPDDRFGGAF